MTKEEVRELMLTADTPEECREAWHRRAEYLKSHPEDLEYFMDAGEVLAMVQTSFGEELLTSR